MAVTKDIVIYGGGFAGVAAAAKAAANLASGKTIALIVPDPVNHSGSGACLGGLGTIGGQNFFDVRPRTGTKKDFYTMGTFNWWITKMGQHYGTDEMAALLKSDLAKYGTKITYYYGYDIVSIGWQNPASITSVKVRQIKRNSSGIVVWETVEETINGKVFIDASDSGRLTQLANFGGTAGRFGFPSKFVDLDESTPGKGRQQVASLMFKIKGFNPNVSSTDIEIAKHEDGNGVISANGGTATYKNKSGKIYAFNQKYGPTGFAIKPFNLAQNGKGSSEWWVNTLLVFNVDGRAYNRDRSGDSSKAFPKEMLSGYKTVDDAWVQARNMIANQEFLAAFRTFPGCSNATIVTDSSGKPAVGEVLYIRESVHSALSATARAHGTSNTNYALTTDACNKAGTNSSNGADKQNYAQRIGLNYYRSDINGYKFSDLKDANGNYLWGGEVGAKVRSDLGITAETPTNPVYVPYRTIVTNFVSNLLIPGYAASISSFAWAECRVLPNLCVLGDAAGVAAAYSITNNKQPLNLTTADIQKIQTTLKNSGARLDK